MTRQNVGVVPSDRLSGRFVAQLFGGDKERRIARKERAPMGISGPRMPRIHVSYVKISPVDLV